MATSVAWDLGLRSRAIESRLSLGASSSRRRLRKAADAPGIASPAIQAAWSSRSHSTSCRQSGHSSRCRCTSSSSSPSSVPFTSHGSSTCATLCAAASNRMTRSWSLALCPPPPARDLRSRNFGASALAAIALTTRGLLDACGTGVRVSRHGYADGPCGPGLRPARPDGFGLARPAVAPGRTHAASSPRSASSDLSRRRAWNILVFTVSTGQPRMVAISRYVQPS